MLMDGVRLMAVGMFAVFAFLSLLVALMQASAAFFAANAHRFPEDEDATEAGRTRGERGDEGEVALAIALAEVARRGGGGL